MSVELVAIEVKTKTGTKTYYRPKHLVDAQQSVSTGRISAKNPFKPESLAVHSTELQETIEKTGHNRWEHTDNGFVRPTFDSMKEWRGFLAKTGRYDRDGFE